MTMGGSASGGTNASANDSDTGLMPIAGGADDVGTPGSEGDEGMGGRTALGTAPSKADQCGEGTELGENGKCVAVSSDGSGGCACDAQDKQPRWPLMFILGLILIGRLRFGRRGAGQR